MEYRYQVKKMWQHLLIYCKEYTTSSIEIISIHGNTGSGTSDAMYNMIYQSACFNNAFVSANAWPQNMIDRKYNGNSNEYNSS